MTGEKISKGDILQVARKNKQRQTDKVKALNVHSFQQQFVFGLNLILAVFALLAILISIHHISTRQAPNEGIIVTPRNFIEFVDPLGPANNLLLHGDQIIAINGIPLENREAASNEHSRALQANEPITFNILRGAPGEPTLEREVTVPLSNGSFLQLIIQLSPILTAACFWLVGLPTIIFKPDNRAGTLFTVFCFLWAAFISIPSVPESTGSWILPFLPLITWLTGATTMIFHLELYFSKKPSPWYRRLFILIITISTIGMGFEVVHTFFRSPFIDQVSDVSRSSWIILSIVVMLILLIMSVTQNHDQTLKRSARIIAVGSFTAFIPLFSFSLIPDLLSNVPALPYLVAVFPIILIPLAYRYSVVKLDSLNFANYATRSTSFLITSAIFCAVYFIIGTLLNSFFPRQFPPVTTSMIALVWLLAFFYRLGYQRVRIFIDQQLFGGWYDSVTIMSKVASNIESTAADTHIPYTFCKTIQESMRLTFVDFYWPNDIGDLVCIASVNIGTSDDTPQSLPPELSPQLQAVFNETPHALSPEELLKRISLLAPQNSTTQSLRFSPNASLILPVLYEGDTYGCYVLGYKRSRDVFSISDLKILNIVSSQTSLVLHNIHLLESLEKEIHESAKYRRETVRVRDEERKRISIDLHDHIIQELVGLKYEVSTLISPTAINGNSEDITLAFQEKLSEIISMTRDVCYNLRYPTLDLGLIPSIRSRITKFELDSGLDVALHLEGATDIHIPENIALCLYLVANEALNNIIKHAQATAVNVIIQFSPQKIVLTLADNGQGFKVPLRLGAFMDNNHFGLVGIRERLDLLQGQLLIHSAPGEGTLITAEIPLYQV